MKKRICLLLICLSIAFTTGYSQENSGMNLKWDESLASSMTPEDFLRMQKMDVAEQEIAFVVIVSPALSCKDWFRIYQSKNSKLL